MDTLFETRLLKKYNKVWKHSLEECFNQHRFFQTDKVINENSEAERKDIINKINNNDFIINDYISFLKSLSMSKRSGYLSHYSAKDFKEANVKTFQVKGYNIGFALKPEPNSNEVDIISVHNNSGIGGIGDALIQSAIKHGGNKLDHFEGYLSDYYKKHGFEEYDRYAWDEKYKPEDWNDEDGTPDVVFRRLSKQNN